MAHRTIVDFDERRKAAGIPTSEVCRRSGVAESTVSRLLHSDVSPRTNTIDELNKALDDLAREQEANHGEDPK